MNKNTYIISLRQPSFSIKLSRKSKLRGGYSIRSIRSWNWLQLWASSQAAAALLWGPQLLSERSEPSAKITSKHPVLVFVLQDSYHVILGYLSFGCVKRKNSFRYRRMVHRSQNSQVIHSFCCLLRHWGPKHTQWGSLQSPWIHGNDNPDFL